jgi:hypothetical protein
MMKRVLVRLLVAPAFALVIGSALILAGDAIIKTPIQLHNGICSKQYAENYRAKSRWFEPTCILPLDSDVSEDLDTKKRQR